MFVSLDINAAVIRTEVHQVERCKVTRGVIKEHVFRARVGRIDATRIRAGVPFVDRAVVLDPRISAGPCSFADFVPQFTCGNGFGNFAIGTTDQVPVAVIKNSLQEFIGNTDRVIRVLTRYGQVSLGVPIGVIGFEADLGKALTGEFDDFIDIGIRDHDSACRKHSFFELRVLTRGETIFGVSRTIPVVAGCKHGGEVFLGQLGTSNEGGNFLLFDDFPVDVFFDIGVINIDHDHFGRTTGGAT